MYANNRKGRAPSAMFRTAGGSIYTFAHPFLTGHLSDYAKPTGAGLPVMGDDLNEVDISKSLKLMSQFFSANPAQDNALQEVMVDGSTITITNHLMNGRAVLTVVPGTGLVRDGDLTAIAPFIMSAKDNVGGVLCRRRFTSAGALTRVYYGATFANFPHDIDVGNAVAEYQMTLLYAGWIEGITSGTSVEKVLWAVGNKYGYKGTFEPFYISGVGKVSEAGVENEAASTTIDHWSADIDPGAGASIDANAPAGYGTLEGNQTFDTGWGA